MAEAIEHPKLPVADRQECLTNNLRWTKDGKLQQQCVITSFVSGKVEEEWRDVPTMTEEEDKPKRGRKK